MGWSMPSMPCCAREGRTLATYGLASGPQGYRPLREFLVAKLKRDAGIACTADDILIVSGSLQALDLVNARCWRAATPCIVEQDTYQGTLNRLDAARRQRGRHSARRATACAWMRWRQRWPTCKARGITPKYIYTIPTVQNPTGTIMPEARRAELLQLSQQYGVPIFEDDCYADLIWDGERPPALYAMSKTGNVIHIGSFSKSIAPALRVGFIVAPWAMHVAHAGAEDRRRLRRAGADGAGRILRAAFRRRMCRSCARPARQARDADGGAQRAVRHRGRIRRPEGRHLPVGEAARQCRHA